MLLKFLLLIQEEYPNPCEQDYILASLISHGFGGGGKKLTIWTSL